MSTFVPQVVDTDRDEGARLFVVQTQAITQRLARRKSRQLIRSKGFDNPNVVGSSEISTEEAEINGGANIPRVKHYEIEIIVSE